jgi:hypothetical protein
MPTLSAPAAPSVTINNTAYLFFVLFGAFIVFITIRGDLPKWLGLLGLAGSPSGGTTTANTTSANGPPTPPSTPNLLGNASSDASSANTYGGVISTATPNNSLGVDAGTWDTGGV